MASSNPLCSGASGSVSTAPLRVLTAVMALGSLGVANGICDAASDLGKTSVISLELSGGPAKVLCGEDAAGTAARIATDRRTAMSDAEVVLSAAKKVQAALDKQAPDYKPPDKLDAGTPEERPRMLKTGGQFSRRAMAHSKADEFKFAVADILRALLRTGLDATAEDRLKSTMTEFLKKQQKRRKEKAADGDLSELFENMEIEDNVKEMKDVDLKALKKVYRELSIKYHPDKSPESAQRFNAIRDSYEILSDPVKVMLYDTGGADLVKKFESGSSDLDRTDNIELDVHVTLKELYTGEARKVNWNRRVVCRSCRLQPNLPRCKKCNRCPGEFRQQQRWLNQHQYTVEEVEIPSDEKCMEQRSEMTVNIERGMMNGDRIHNPHKASEMPKKIPGDVLVTVRVGKHPEFKRVSNDLLVTIRVTLYEALLGFERELVHLDGHMVKFSVDRGKVLKPGAGLTITGEGMPLREDPSAYGNLIVLFDVEFPKHMPEDAAASFESAFAALGQGPGPTRLVRGRGIKTEL